MSTETTYKHHMQVQESNSLRNGGTPGKVSRNNSRQHSTSSNKSVETLSEADNSNLNQHTQDG